ncbi:MAG TPA: hypothetical protein DD727_01255 [Clostridiales bacterium]|nr:hypothetical protein [Clostridiales bacterium]
MPAEAQLVAGCIVVGNIMVSVAAVPAEVGRTAPFSAGRVMRPEVAAGDMRIRGSPASSRQADRRAEEAMSQKRRNACRTVREYNAFQEYPLTDPLLSIPVLLPFCFLNYYALYCVERKGLGRKAQKAQKF